LTLQSKISVVVATYRREIVLINTLRHLLEWESFAEILVVDQTVQHESATLAQLQAWRDDGQINWILLKSPSITGAMNHALIQCSSDLILFLDDDIQPLADLATAHSAAHAADPELWATVGQVIQPWQEPEVVGASRNLSGLRKDFDFPFHSTIDAEVENVMAGNLCVNRQRALSIGGFDENFTGSAYRFETEFARRVIAAGGKIRFLGGAGIRHLRVQEGGTRSEGSHLTSASPKHGFGDYYYSYLHGGCGEGFRYRLSRLLGEVSTKFHLTHPWWIPVKLLGELRAWRQAKKKSGILRN